MKRAFLLLISLLFFLYQGYSTDYPPLRLKNNVTIYGNLVVLGDSISGFYLNVDSIKIGDQVVKWAAGDSLPDLEWVRQYVYDNGSGIDTTFLKQISGWYVAGGIKLWRCIDMSENGQYRTATASDGVYVSNDYGLTWIKKTGVSGIDISVDSSGQHQTVVNGQTVFSSSNYGVDWSEDVLSGIETDNLTSITTSAAGTYKIAVGSGKVWSFNSLTGVWGYSAVNAYSWADIDMSDYGKYVLTAYGTIEGTGYLMVSSDSGLTFTEKGPAAIWTCVSVDSSGRYMTATNSTHLYYSHDYGVTWTQGQAGLVGARVSESGQYQIAFSSSGIYVSSDYGVNWTLNGEARAWADGAIGDNGKKMAAIASNGQIYQNDDYGNGSVYQLQIRAKPVIPNWQSYIGVDVPATQGYVNANTNRILTKDFTFNNILNGDSIIIVPACANDSIINIESIYLGYDHRNNEYTVSGTDSTLIYNFFGGNKNPFLHIKNEFFTTSGDKHKFINIDYDISPGSPIWIKFNSGLATGEGSMRIRVKYFIIKAY
jgi:hypothetical protein